MPRHCTLLNRFFKLQRQIPDRCFGMYSDHDIPDDFSIDQIDQYGYFRTSTGKSSNVLIRRRNTIKEDMILLSNLREK